MSDSIAQSISGTGTFRVPNLPAKVEQPATGGKASAETGKALPPAPATADLEKIAEAMNQKSRLIGGDLRFEVDLDSGRSVIQVLDRETGEIIRQIPPEKITPEWKENGALEVRLYDEVV